MVQFMKKIATQLTTSTTPYHNSTVTRTKYYIPSIHVVLAPPASRRQAAPAHDPATHPMKPQVTPDRGPDTPPRLYICISFEPNTQRVCAERCATTGREEPQAHTRRPERMCVRHRGVAHSVHKAPRAAAPVVFHSAPGAARARVSRSRFSPSQSSGHRSRPARARCTSSR